MAQTYRVTVDKENKHPEQHTVTKSEILVDNSLLLSSGATLSYAQSDGDVGSIIETNKVVSDEYYPSQSRREVPPLRHKPIAIEVSSWSPFTRIFYACPKCKTDFRFHQDNELFCHRCGTAIDWNVILDLEYPFTQKDDVDAEEQILESINTRNMRH